MEQLGVHRSKSQAVNKYLPGVWIDYQDEKDPRLNGKTVSVEVKYWNQKKMELYGGLMESRIKSQIRAFADKGGDDSAFQLKPWEESFSFIEVNQSEGFSEIKGAVSPLVFYCSNCCRVTELKDQSEITPYFWRCSYCKKYSIKQLQMIYSCSCGHAEPFRISALKCRQKELFYSPSGGKNNFKMYYYEQKKPYTVEFGIQCNCGNRLWTRNATDSSSFHPFSVTVVNLVKEAQENFLKKGLRARYIILAHWFGILDNSAYDSLMKNADTEFDKERNLQTEQYIQQELKKFQAVGLDSAMLAMMENSLRGGPGSSKLDEVCEKAKMALGAVVSEERVNTMALRLLEYDTLKRSNNSISMEEALQKALELRIILRTDEICSFTSRMGIKRMQAACDIQLFHGTYGYTRVYRNPADVKNGRLKLMTFERDDRSNYRVYSNILNTEGILVEIDMVQILVWLFKNQVIQKECLPDLEDENAVKRWFLEQIDGEQITIFSTEEDFALNDPTIWVYRLLHTISHSFIISAGEFSGLEKGSFNEILFPETASIFIYTQTVQGLTLGSLSGMFEQNLYQFLDYAYTQTRECIFDPICSHNGDTKCSACLYLPETSCAHFNNDLGRKFLYTMPEVPENKIIGFWET